MPKPTHDPATLTTSLFIGGSLLLILFLAFSWGNSLLKQAAIDSQIESFQRENDRIARENTELAQQLKYLESPQYRDKWAKQHEGLAQPGEEVIVIEFRPHALDEDRTEDEAVLQREILLSRPNREQWQMFFFGEL